MKFHFAQRPDESTASYRYRVKDPAAYLQSIGWEPQKSWWLADVVVMGKHWFPARDFAFAKEVKRRGMCMAFDVCDWHMDDALGPHYRRMIALADGLIVPNESWASVGLPKPVHIAGDGYEWDEKPPKCEAGSPLKILWYGHISNYPLLQKVPAPRDSVLEVVTSKGPHQFKVWSPEVMKDAYEWCDLVIVPAESALKSANRQIEAIRQGRFVVSSDLPQHRPTGTYCGDISEGIEWYRNNLREAFLRLQDAQSAVKRLHAPEVIGEQWKSALTAIHAQQSKRAA